jgi:hypothetical protein
MDAANKPRFSFVYEFFMPYEWENRLGGRAASMGLSDAKFMERRVSIDGLDSGYSQISNPRMSIGQVLFHLDCRDGIWEHILEAFDLKSNGDGTFSAMEKTDATVPASGPPVFTAQKRLNKMKVTKPVPPVPADVVALIDLMLFAAGELTVNAYDPSGTGYSVRDHKTTAVPSQNGEVFLTDDDQRVAMQLGVPFAKLLEEKRKLGGVVVSKVRQPRPTNIKSVMEPEPVEQPAPAEAPKPEDSQQ